LKLGAYLSKGFLIGGASGGAHFAAVLAHRARDDPFFNSRTLTGQIIQIPSLLHPERQLPDEYGGFAPMDILLAEINPDTKPNCSLWSRIKMRPL
jgi:acetyl esterase/lipase